jgi:hypothetical protein
VCTILLFSEAAGAVGGEGKKIENYSNRTEIGLGDDRHGNWERRGRQFATTIWFGEEKCRVIMIGNFGRYAGILFIDKNVW